MTNAEKYREEIENYEGNTFCEDFICPIILKRNDCSEIGCCNRCHMLRMLWLMDEYKEEPDVDWSKVTVDTPILVRDYEDSTWFKRHFAKYEDDSVFAWIDGQTSWTTKEIKNWKFAKLIGENGEE